VLSYENARENHAGVVQELANFTGVLNGKFEKVVKQSEFESMKKLELKLSENVKRCDCMASDLAIQTQ
jgi:hypothetical protein